MAPDSLVTIKGIMKVKLLLGYHFNMKSIPVSRPLQWLAKIYCILVTIAIIWALVVLAPCDSLLGTMASINMIVEVGIYYITPIIWHPNIIEYSRRVIHRSQRYLYNNIIFHMLIWILTIPVLSVLFVGTFVLLMCMQGSMVCSYNSLGAQILLAFALLTTKIGQIPKHLLLGLLYCDSKTMRQFFKNHAFCNFASPYNMSYEYLIIYHKILKDFKEFENLVKVKIIISLLSLSSFLVYVTLHVSSFVLGGYTTMNCLILVTVILNESLNVIPTFVMLEMIANTGDDIRCEILKQKFIIKDELSRLEMSTLLQFVRSRPLRLSCLWGSMPFAAVLAIRLFCLTVTYLIAVLQINHIGFK